MQYNTTRSPLLIREYGRNIHLMAAHLLTIEDRKERSLAANTVIDVMAQMTPQSRDVADVRHKLWDHLHMLCGFNLDVDAPYPKPIEPESKAKTDRLSYPSQSIRIKHYGKVLEKMIEYAITMPEGPERSKFTEIVANQMKQLYRNWNKSVLNDEEVFNDLKKLSRGNIVLSTEEVTLDNVKDVSFESEYNQRRNKFKKKNNFRKRNK